MEICRIEPAMRYKNPPNPTWDEIDASVKEFRKREGRDSIYRVATFLLDKNQWWGQADKMADALKVLLLTWNQAFYRFGLFDEADLREAIKRALPLLEQNRTRSIASFGREDEGETLRIFNEFYSALAIKEGSRKGHRTPVGVAKALHLLAPDFFPLWDDRIARRYRCHYGNGRGATSYLKFMHTVSPIVDRLQRERPGEPQVVKRLDEHNYARYTKEWL